MTAYKNLFCTICGGFTPDGTVHKCPPKLRIWEDRDGYVEDDGQDLFADDAGECVEKWAYKDDFESAEFRIVGGHEAAVFVRGPDGETTRWVVSGETERVYQASRSDG